MRSRSLVLSFLFFCSGYLIPIQALDRPQEAADFSAYEPDRTKLKEREVQREDILAIFGKSYYEALDFIEKNRAGFVAAGEGIPPPPLYEEGLGGPGAFLAALVFPELLRYSRIRDRIEIGGLQLIYLGKGSDFGNFSVGPFQMKPGFVENLEVRVKQLGLSDPFSRSILGFVSEEPAEKRKERLRRLQDKDWQLRYLAVFVLVSRSRFGGFIDSLRGYERILFYASAYNGGLERSEKAILDTAYSRRFPVSGGPREERFNYGALSHYFLKNEAGRIFFNRDTKINKQGSLIDERK